MRVAVIPARGGSKRIPRKNIKDFCGKPMIAWSIETARDSKLFDRVVVSTEDPEIAAVGGRWAAEIVDRPSSLADDYAGTTEVIGHAAQWTLDRGWPVTSICCIYATAPFIEQADLARGAAAVESGGWTYAFAATTFAAPIFRAFRQHPEGGLEMFFPEHFTTRSQDLPVALHDAGQFYWGSPAAWIARKGIFERHSMPVMVPRWRVQDIDDADDWKRAEFVFRQVKDIRS